MIKKLRVGIILPAGKIPAWIALALENIASLAEVEYLAFVVTAARPASSRLFENHLRIDRALFHPAPDAWELRDLNQSLQNTRTIIGLDEQNESRLKSLKLDVLINPSLVEYPDFFLDCARHGVWSLHDGVNRFAWGSPVGWRERLFNAPLLVCDLEVARRGQPMQIAVHTTMAADPHSISRNQNHLFWKACAILPHALKRLAWQGGDEFFSKSMPLEAHQSSALPLPGQTYALASRQIREKIVSKIQRWFEFNQWAILLKKGAGGAPLAWEGFQRIVPPKDRFWADPFLVEREGRAYLFVEEFLYRRKRGHINCMEIDVEGRVVSNQTVLERPYHLSYPFIFQERGEWYMLPETGRNNTVEVYRCTRFPGQWEFHKTLLKGVRAVDATLIEHAGLWWMFVTIAGHGMSTWDSLHLFYADNPLLDDWTPHPRNPIISDVRSARMAGRLFRRDGNLFRPSQDSSRRYGYALNLNRVETLTTTEYSEVLEQKLEPPANSDIVAAHTFNSSANWTVMDMQIRRKR